MPKQTLSVFFLCGAVLWPFASVYAQGAAALSKGDWIAYVGTYTKKSKGIYAYKFEPSSGKLTSLGLAAESSNPTFIAVSPNQRFLYAVNEDNPGMVSAFAIDSKTGQLKLLNKVSAHGDGPCHVALDKTGKWVFIANYGSGSAASFPVQSDGSLGEAAAFVQHKGSSVNRQRQSGPHGHSANLSPDNRFVWVADLGLDEILSYKLDQSNGALTPNDPPFAKVAPGSGPRHMTFGKSGQFAYVLSEMVSTVTAFRYDAAKGAMQEIQTVSSVPADFTGQKSSAEIAVHPNGDFLYASNRGGNTIALFNIDKAKGTLTVVDYFPTQGRTPRHFAIDPSGAYLFAENQDTDNFFQFRIDPKTGRLTPGGGAVEVGSPVCMVFAHVQ